jgi:hypothetical protein
MVTTVITFIYPDGSGKTGTARMYGMTIKEVNASKHIRDTFPNIISMKEED